MDSATANAKLIAKVNNIKNVDILSGKCEKLIDQIKLDNINDLVVFVDPARAGLDKRVINALINLSPRKIVYMSCNPETCVSDCKQLITDNKYIISDINTWDMFPYTKHVETLVCLQRQV